LQKKKDSSDYKNWNNDSKYWGTSRGEIGQLTHSIWESNFDKNARSLTKYAMTDPEEYFAEAFARYKRTGKIDDIELKKLFDAL
jgi:hypothetical protein